MTTNDSDSRSALPSEGVLPEDFREAFSRWATGVSIVAVRDPADAKVHATTVSSLASVSAVPPVLGFALGPGAQVLPFLPEARRFVVNILAQGQASLATRYTDPFPVGPSPFPAEGQPVIPGTLARLHATVLGKVPVGSSRIVLGRVDAVELGDADEPLLYFGRDYRRLSP